MNLFERVWSFIRTSGVFCTVEDRFRMWFYGMTWRHAANEARVRKELIERARKQTHVKTLRRAVLCTHELLLTVLNERYGGITLEQHVPSMSVASFEGLYSIVMTLVCFRLGRHLGDLREDLTSICRDSNSVETTWKMLSGLEDDENLQANRIWDECPRVMNGDSFSKYAFYRGFFVVVANRRINELARAKTPASSPSHN